MGTGSDGSTVQDGLAMHLQSQTALYAVILEHSLLPDKQTCPTFFCGAGHTASRPSHL